MQSQHYNQQNKFNSRISDTNNNKLRTNNKQIKQAINEYTNWHLLKTYSFINLNFDKKNFRRICNGYKCISRKY